MEKIPLKAQARGDKNPKTMRRGGNIPCVVYGNVANTVIQCEEQDLKKAYQAAGESTLVALDIDGKAIPVLFHTIDLDPVTDRLIHADFYAVDMKKEVEASVPVRLTGESLAVKDLGGILVTALSHVRVRCLPTDLPHELSADLGKLAVMHAVLMVKDIPLPKGVAIVEPPETVIVTVQEPRQEEVETPAVPAEGEAAAGAEGAAAGEKKEGEDAPTAEKKDAPPAKDAKK